jgi:hypothetical protein
MATLPPAADPADVDVVVVDDPSPADMKDHDNTTTTDRGITNPDDLCHNITTSSNDDSSDDPFEAYETKEQPYQWPCMYDEMDDMFECCCLIYAVAELREKARQGEIDDPKVLQLPLTALEVLHIVETNQKILTDSKFGKSFYLDLLQVLARREQIIATSTRNVVSTRLHSKLVAFNDCRHQEEMVYGIAVNPKLKRITICFRGSITKMDWSMNRRTFMTSFDNPVPASKLLRNAKTKIRVHNGFYRYLCEPLSEVRRWAKQQADRGKREKVDFSTHKSQGELAGLSQYEEMLKHHLLGLVKEYPGYKVCHTMDAT